jgi:hypothetical protein
MTQPDPTDTPENLFDAIAQLLEPGQREYFYQRMLYFRHLRPEDELLRIVEAVGFLALIIRGAPHAVAIEREQLATLLATSIVSFQAAAEATQAYHRQLEDRLTRLPQEILRGLSPEAIARPIIESVRQQFVQSGLPATAEALSIVSNHLNQTTGDLHRAAGQLAGYSGVTDQVRRAIDQIMVSLSNATNNARFAAEEVLHRFKFEYNLSLGMFCGAAMLLGVLLEFSVQSCAAPRSHDVPQSAVPAVQTVAPITPEPRSPQSPPKKPRQVK